jgi:hypothetical protein
MTEHVPDEALSACSDEQRKAAGGHRDVALARAAGRATRLARTPQRELGRTASDARHLFVSDPGRGSHLQIAARRRVPRRHASECAGPLAKPMPGSSTRRQRGIPAWCAAAVAPCSAAGQSCSKRRAHLQGFRDAEREFVADALHLRGRIARHVATPSRLLSVSAA